MVVCMYTLGLQIFIKIFMVQSKLKIIIMNRDYHISYKTFRNLNNKYKQCNAYNLRAKCGVFANTELEYCNKIKQQILNKSCKPSSNHFFNLLKQINIIVAQTLKTTVNKGMFLYYNNRENITSELLKKIRLASFKSDVAESISNSNNTVFLPYINTYLKNESYKVIQYNNKDSYIIHPRAKLNSVIKDNNCDINFCQKYSQMLMKKSLSELINIKNDINKKTLTYLSKSDNTYNFIFSKVELQKLKLLANKYDVIQNLLVSNGINTTHIETIIFNNKENGLNIGDKLFNGDIVLRKTQIYDKQKKSNIDAILTFANTDRGYRFKIYKDETFLFNQTSNIIKRYKHYIKTGDVNNINKLNLNLFNQIKDNEIAEVYINEYNKKEMRKLLTEDNSVPEERIEQFLQENEKYYYIKNLKNFNLQKFQNVSLQLITSLKEFGRINNVNKAFLEALAFNNIKHSPVFLYLRAGCIPISCQKENLEKFLHSGFDYKKNVWLMYEM